MNASRLARLGDLAYRRRGRIVIAWIAVFAAVLAIVPRFAGDFEVDFSTPGTESQAAQDLVEAHFPRNSGETVIVAWEAPAGARSVDARVDRFVAQAERVEGIGEASEPRYSRDGTIGLVELSQERPTPALGSEPGERLIALAEAASGNGLSIELGGFLIGEAEEGAPPEMVGLIAAAFVLLIAFGSVVAAGLPLLVAIFGLGISATLIGLLAIVIDTPNFAPAVAGLIGIGVGIDYSLLILTRFRSALVDGADVREALIEATSTAGRSAIVAGGTVVISLFGLFFMGVSFLYGVALSASLAVLVVMAASVTLLPALLAFAGRRVDRLHIPGLGRSLRTGNGGTLAARWSGLVQRRAAIAAVAGAAVLIALTAPVLGLRYGFPDDGNNPEGSTTREAYDLVSRGFGPGSYGPLLLAVDLSGDGSARALDELTERLRATPGVAFVTEPRVSPDGEAALLSAMPATKPQDAATVDLVRNLRDEVIQGALPDGPQVHIGGATAVSIDQSEYVADRIPLFIAGVVLLSFLLLLLAFRAPVIALKAGVMNVFSVGAAYGVVAFAAEGGAHSAACSASMSRPLFRPSSP